MIYYFIIFKPCIFVQNYIFNINNIKRYRNEKVIFYTATHLYFAFA